MQFMMLMIPNVYQGNKKLNPGFVPDPKKIEEMTRFNQELGKALKILSLNGLHPLNTGAHVFRRKGKPTVTDGPFIEVERSAGRLLARGGHLKRRSWWNGRSALADEGDVIESGNSDAADFAIKK